MKSSVACCFDTAHGLESKEPKCNKLPCLLYTNKTQHPSGTTYYNSKSQSPEKVNGEARSICVHARSDLDLG